MEKVQIEVREDSRAGASLGCVYQSILRNGEPGNWHWESWRPQDHARTEGMYESAGEALDAMLSWMEEE